MSKWTRESHDAATLHKEEKNGLLQGSTCQWAVQKTKGQPRKTYRQGAFED